MAHLPGDRLEITGHIEGADAIIVLRIDDSASRDYASRVNLERVFPPGPFRWQTVLDGLTTPAGRPIDAARIRRVMAFKAAGDGRVRLSAIRRIPARQLPYGARGFALGAANAPLPEGFERISPGDPRLVGGSPAAVRRPLPDPLAANGVRGLSRLVLPWPKGRARVTIWADDPGEWELLPHPLHRRILVNGRTALDESFAPAEWMRHHYLAGRDAEHAASDDAWHAFGRKRAIARSLEVDVEDDGVVLLLEGSDPSARFLNGVLIEPAGERRALDRVIADRTTWYRENWPVLRHALGSAEPDVARLQIIDGRLVPDRPLRVRLAPGSATRLRIRLSGLRSGDAAALDVVEPPALSGLFTVQIWMARQRLDRRHAQQSFLTLADVTLHPARPTGPVPDGDHRLYELRVTAGTAAPPGSHIVSAAFSVGGRRMTTPVTLDVLGVTLPKATRPAGIYLDQSPHLAWFAEFEGHRPRQLACDLAFVATDLGLAGSAPGLATPGDAAGTSEFRSDLDRADAAKLSAPYLAYAPTKRIMAALGTAAGAARIQQLTDERTRRGLPAILWSIADEPSNAGSGGDWSRWLAALRAKSGTRVRLAGHLNAASDSSIAARFDTVLVNPGYGLDLETIASTARNGPGVWLYNTGRPRLTAGLWLWLSAADRYIQWHGRMPTAHPFDPIDGREGDEQLLLPSSDPCPILPSIHRDLLDLADGVTDQRWLLWLDGRPEAKAQALAADIRRRASSSWKKALMLTRQDLQTIRESIMDLAEELTGER
ncbi:MAG: hypothetical protein R3D27_06760 [Hyphomicrobiaceae bacterium]